MNKLTLKILAIIIVILCSYLYMRNILIIRDLPGRYYYKGNGFNESIGILDPNRKYYYATKFEYTQITHKPDTSGRISNWQSQNFIFFHTITLKKYAEYNGDTVNVIDKKIKLIVDDLVVNGLIINGKEYKRVEKRIGDKVIKINE